MIDARPCSFAEVVGYRPTPLAPSQMAAHGTTVLALRFADGVLVLADRRATMGNLIMYERAEKVIPLDGSTVIAISGAYARSAEVSRFLQHAFKFYERLNLHELSTEGKLMEITRALAENLPMAMEGVGMFLPIVAAYDRKAEQFGVFFFDAAGARFESGDYACAGSGSERIRGVLEYVCRTQRPWAERPLEEVLTEGLRMLDIASDLDSSTGGFRKVLPSATVLERAGVRTLGNDVLGPAAARVLGRS